MNRIVLIIALLVGGQALAQTRRQAQPSRAAVHAAVESYLKANVNDPRRLEIVRISRSYVSTAMGLSWSLSGIRSTAGAKRVPTATAYKWMGGRAYRDYKPLGVVRKGFWEPIGRKGWAVGVRFRATNKLGALVLADKVFCISGGVVFDWMNLGDFHPTRPKKRSDPLTDAFMKLAR